MKPINREELKHVQWNPHIASCFHNLCLILFAGVFVL